MVNKEYNRLKRIEAKSNGKCSRCWKRDPIAGMKRCGKCYEEQLSAGQQFRDRKKAKRACA